MRRNGVTQKRERKHEVWCARVVITARRSRVTRT